MPLSELVPQRNSPLTKYHVLAGALVLAAFALRLFRLDAQDIWWDEARNIFTASRALEAIASAPELDVHPPLYFYLLHLWTGLAGTSELAVRFFSLWFGVAAIPLAFRLGAMVQDRKVGLWAAFIAALSPFFIDEAQQTRMYTLLVFLSALSIYWLLCAVRAHDRRYWIAYAAVSLAGFYTHYSFVFVLAAQNLFLALCLANFWHKRTPAREFLTRWVLSQAAIGLLYLLQAPNILRQTQIYGNPGMSLPSISQYGLDLITAFLLGQKILLSDAVIPSVGIVLVLAAGLVAAIAGRRMAVPWQGAALLLVCILVPLVAYYIVLLKSPQFTPRYIMVVVLPLYVLLAMALARLSYRSLALGVVAGVVLLGADARVLESQYFNPAFFSEDTRGLAQFVSETATPEDLVLIDVPYPFGYYYHGASPAHYLFVDIHTTAGVVTQLAQGKRRVFYITWYKSDTDPRGYVYYLLDKYATYQGEQAFRGYDVVWYQLPPSPHMALAPAPQPMSAVFGDRVVLTGVSYGGAQTARTPDPDAAQVVAGGKAWATLWWKLAQPVRENFKVSVVLRDAAGNTVAQDDRMLINDRHLKTALWTTAETAINVYTPELEGNVPPGEYTLNVIVYDPDSGARLDYGAGDTLPIGKLQVVP